MDRTYPCINCGIDHFPTRKGRCKNCDHYFRVHGKERPTLIYQSPRKGHLADRSGRTCPNCGALFNPVKFFRREGRFLFTSYLRYCTRECGNAYRLRETKGRPSKRKGKRKLQPGVRCRICNIQFTPIFYSKGRPKPFKTQATCSSQCYAELRRRTHPKVRPLGARHPNWKGGISKLYRRGNGWARITERIRRQQDYRCEHCGRSEEMLGRRLDVHHKIPFHNFARARDANRRANLVGLCRPCHTAADAAIVSRQLSLGLVLAGRKFRPGKAKGERSAAAKMTELLVLQMRRLRAEGASIKELCTKFPVTQTTAQYICSGKSWKHVGGPLSRGRKFGATGPAEVIFRHPGISGG